MLALDQDEVCILGDNNGTLGPGFLENKLILGVPEAKIPQRQTGNTESLRDPGCKGGREVCVQPEDHAARTG